jgi:hypothetical protein
MLSVLFASCVFMTDICPCDWISLFLFHLFLVRYHAQYVTAMLPPLTTAFSPARSCSQLTFVYKSTPSVVVADSTTSTSTVMLTNVQVALPIYSWFKGEKPLAAACFPPYYSINSVILQPTSTIFYFSPGVCPSDYTINLSTTVADETLALCVPN